MHTYFLQKKLEKLQPKSLTVDIFDTILLRTWAPEQWRFFILAKAMQTEFARANIPVTRYFIYTHRNEFTRLLRDTNIQAGHDHETTHTKIFKLIIGEVVRRSSVKLSKKQVEILLKCLTQIELKFEISQLKPNKSLLKALKALPKKTKVYFVSDMYLETPQLKKLLKAHSIDIFSDGISSADHLHGKSSGRSFERLQDKHLQIDFSTNLHIGDNRISDATNPKRLGMQTFWLYLPLHRSKLFIGKYLFKIMLKLRVRQIYSEQQDRFSEKLEELEYQEGTNAQASTLEAQGIGWIFAPAVIYYLHSLGLTSNLKESVPIFVTGESEVFSDLYNQLGFGTAKTLPSLNRTSLIRAYVAILDKKNVQLETMLPFVKKILRRKNKLNALATLGIAKPGSNYYFLLGKKSQSTSALKEIDLTAARKLWQTELKNTLKQWQKVTNKKSQSYIITDIGWNDTVQILLSEILAESNVASQLSGVYLGRTGTNIFDQRIITASEGVIFNSLNDDNALYLYQPEVWESFLNRDNKNNPTRKHILDGIKACIEYFNRSGLTAEEFYFQNEQKLIEELQFPSKHMISTLAKLDFDYGTQDEPICPMINTHSSTLKVWKMLLLDRNAFKSFYFHQGWKWGAATYYHFRLPYRLWRFKTKKPSF
ncbi:HAD family hydrolase [Candidatus Saccharibacteria bacterium]|nr:HAD family hydrolase [Candidatus Saccharibacteria bacterium]